MIDEKKLLEKIDNNVPDLTSDQIYKIAEVIVKQPKLNEWIPVSERLPVFGERVLCSLNLDNPTIIHPVVISTRSTDKYWYDGTIVAWQPMPEPYKRE